MDRVAQERQRRRAYGRWRLRVLVPLALLVLAVVPGPPAFAQTQPQLKELALPSPSIGTGWLAQMEKTQPVEDLGQMYLVLYSAPGPDAAVLIGLVSLPNPALTELAATGVRDALIPTGATLERWSGLGDAPGWRGSTTADGAAAVLYMYRVQNMLALVMYAVPEGSDPAAEALRLASLQQDYLRARLTSPSTPSPTQLLPYCQPGQPAQFRLGFGQLWTEVGPIMGQPVECEHADPASGDIQQKTTTGLAVYPKATGSPTFSKDGQQWALTADGLLSWTGAAADPPPAARAASLDRRGLSRWRAGDLDGAAQDLDRAIAFAPDSAPSYNTRALVRAARGELDLALADADRAVQLSGDHVVHALDTRAYVYLKLGRAPEALADYDTVFALSPDGGSPTESYLGRGLALEAAGPAGAGQEQLAEGLRRAKQQSSTPQLDDLVALARETAG